jgi:hypothetical protein
MAKRGRKPTTITHLMEKDKKGNIVGERSLFTCLWKTRISHEKNLQKHFPNINSKRLKIMFRDGWLLKDEKGHVTLGPKGIKYLKNNMDMKFQYTSKKTANKHDLKLNKKYLQLTTEQQDSWKTENQMRYELHSKKEYWDMYNHPKWGNPNDRYVSRKFMPDAAVKIDGRYVVIEVVTRYYTQADIEQKIETANQFYNGEIQLINI